MSVAVHTGNQEQIDDPAEAEQSQLVAQVPESRGAEIATRFFLIWAVAKEVP